MQESVLTGRWWRAKSYELRDGYLRPAAGAGITPYDPLDDHDFHRTRRRDFVPAYLKLARIVDAPASPEVREREIVEWCAEHGLLGLLLHQVQQVRFAPRWQPAIPLSAEAKRALAPMVRAAHAATLPDGTPINWDATRRSQVSLRLTQKLYQRTSSGTFLWGDEQVAVPAVVSQDAQAGDVSDRATWRLAQPGIILQHLATREWEQESLTTTWARFFPEVPQDERETHAYPMPYSAEFWAAYAEPIEEFLTAAGQLRDAFVAASGKRLRGGRPRKAETNPSGGSYRLNALVAPAGPMLFGEETAYEQRLIAPSLLGALALMAQLDLAGQRRFLRCRNDYCSKLFVGTTVQSVYCSTTCRQAHHARRGRRQTGRER